MTTGAPLEGGKPIRLHLSGLDQTAATGASPPTGTKATPSSRPSKGVSIESSVDLAQHTFKHFYKASVIASHCD